MASDWLFYLDNLLWGYGALPALLILGLLLSYEARFIQLRHFPKVVKTFVQFLFHPPTSCGGVHPLKAFFACIGGCMGVSNVVAICTAVQLGGPGALFWVWAAGLLGMIVKYSEVYLGLRFRVPDAKGGYRGGPMYFLQKVYKHPFLPKLAGVLLCFYGIEIYQFSVVTHSLATNLEVSKLVIVPILLVLVIGVGKRGVKIVGRVGATMIPLFMIIYLGMASWVLIHNFAVIPSVLHEIFTSAFTGHASVGAFAGSGILLAASQGIRRSCYSSDVGVGYASVIHSQTREPHPQRQAALAIFEIFLDGFVICTTSVMVIMVTDLWSAPIEAPLLVQTAFAMYFPAMELFMPLFFLCLGYTTVLTYFCAGIRCAESLFPEYGRRVYSTLAAILLPIFTFSESSHALAVMSIIGALLLMINLYGIFKLRHEIEFKFSMS